MTGFLDTSLLKQPLEKTLSVFGNPFLEMSLVMTNIGFPKVTKTNWKEFQTRIIHYYLTYLLPYTKYEYNDGIENNSDMFSYYLRVIDTFLQQGTIDNLIGLNVNCEKHSKAKFNKRMNEFVSMDVNRINKRNFKTGGN